MESPQVRIATPQDFDAVCRLYDAVVEDNSGTEFDVLWRRDLHPSDAALLQALEEGTLYVAEQGEDLLGAGIVNDDFAAGYDAVPWRVDAPLDRVGCLHLFCVHPGCQGRGVGSRFLKGIMVDCASRGMAALRLDVFAYNAPGRALYEKVGFDLIGITRLTYEDQQVCQIDFAMYEAALEA